MKFKFFKSYRGLWEEQNQEMDMMRADHYREIQNKNDVIETLKIQRQRQDDDYKKIQSKLDLVEKKQDELKIEYEELQEKYRLSKSANGGYKTSNQCLKAKYENEKKLVIQFKEQLKNNNKELIVCKRENIEIKRLLQKIVTQKHHKIDPPTLKELENYNIFRHRKGLNHGNNKHERVSVPSTDKK